MDWEARQGAERNEERLKIAVATADPTVRESLSEVLQGCFVETIWLKSADDVRRALLAGDLSCLVCGFWLENGTYREAVKQVKRHGANVPFLMISTPGGTSEYRDYLASLNVGAFDFICYPYVQTEVKRILQSALAEHQRSHRALETEKPSIGAVAINLAASALSVLEQQSPAPRAA